MPQDIRYATYVWLFSVATGPILLLLVLLVSQNAPARFDEVGGFIGLAFLVGFALSIPCWLVFMAFVRLIHHTRYSVLRKKALIQVGAWVIGIAPFAILFGSEMGEMLTFALPYFVTLSVGIWLFRLEARTPPKPLDLTDHLIDP